MRVPVTGLVCNVASAPGTYPSPTPAAAEVVKPTTNVSFIAGASMNGVRAGRSSGSPDVGKEILTVSVPLPGVAASGGANNRIGFGNPTAHTRWSGTSEFTCWYATDKGLSPPCGT